MGNFFGSIYCLLEEFFGLDLADYLWGVSSPEQTTNMFIGIGLTMFAVSAFVMVVYYYLLDHPKIANWWGWLIFLAANALINFIVGWQWVLQDYYDNLMYKIDESTGQKVDLPIDEGSIACFGVTNMILAIVAFILFSYCFKWWSTNSRHAPF